MKHAHHPLPGHLARQQSGFSLMEILIVIVLIGMVVAFAANQILGGADKAKWQLAKSKVTTLSTKIEGYSLDNGGPPERLEDLVKQPGNASGWLGPYAKDEDIKDPWGRDFEYRTPGENSDYEIISYGKDGKPGGESWNRDIKSSD